MQLVLSAPSFCELKKLMDHGQEKTNTTQSLCTYLKISNQISCIFHFVDSFVKSFRFFLSVFESCL